MKILHTSDWHLGKRLGDFSRMGEQQLVLDEIIAVAEAEKVDVVIVAGDLFDTFNPPAEAVDLFYRSLKKLANGGKRPVVAIAGNHDSPERIESPDPLARECGIVFIGSPNSIVAPFKLDTGFEVLRSEEGFVEFKIPDFEAPLRIVHTAYANEFRLKTYLGSEDNEEQLREILARRWKQLSGNYCNNDGVNILLSHLFFVKDGADWPEEPEDEKPILHVGGAQAVFSSNIPTEMQYVALGHLHRKQTVDSEPCPVMYSGSPVSYSFAEADQKKFVLLADIQPGEKAVLKEIELCSGKKLLRFKANGIEEAVIWLEANRDCLVELTVVSETYLTAADRKILSNAHNGIVNIIPEVTTMPDSVKTARVDLTKTTEELFCDYFRYEKGQEPGERLLGLFRELQAQEDEI